MKKIISLITCIILFTSCNNKQTNQPDIYYSDDHNNQNFIYPINTLVGRSGHTIIGHVYNINGKIIVINKYGGMLEITNKKEYDN